MTMAPTQTGISNGATAAYDLFALTDEQILQIEPDAQDIEILDGGERSDSMDPLREDLQLLAASQAQQGSPHAQDRANAKTTDDGLRAVATAANSTAQTASAANTSVVARLPKMGRRSRRRHRRLSRSRRPPRAANPAAPPPLLLTRGLHPVLSTTPNS